MDTARRPQPTQQTTTKPRLLYLVHGVLRRKHYSMRTEQSYVDWIKRFILFHGKRHPAQMDKTEVIEFLMPLAVQRSVAAATQNQARADAENPAAPIRRRHRCDARLHDGGGGSIHFPGLIAPRKIL